MDKKQFDDEYRQAFNGSEQPADQPTADAAEGATETPAAAVAIGADGGNPEGIEDAAAAAATAEPAPEAAGELPPEAAGATEGESATTPPAADAEMADVPPEDEQAYKSWRGRLDKREQELKAREAAVAEREAAIEESGEGGELLADAPATDEAGEGDADPVAFLRNEFGDEFVDGLRAMVRGELKAIVGEVGTANLGELQAKTDALIEEMRETFGAIHQDRIASEFENVDEISASPEFQKWCEEHANPDECKRVIESGTAREVVKLLKAFSAHLEDKNNSSDAEDAAAGVRGSAALRLPTRAPGSPDDEYKSAWSQM